MWLNLLISLEWFGLIEHLSTRILLLLVLHFFLVNLLLILVFVGALHNSWTVVLVGPLISLTLFMVVVFSNFVVVFELALTCNLRSLVDFGLVKSWFLLFLDLFVFRVAGGGEVARLLPLCLIQVIWAKDRLQITQRLIVYILIIVLLVEHLDLAVLFNNIHLV